ncbi:hypothetical protein BPOR_0104g00060 [Botrytis porri]|uniref:Uncharacterized protein n=1 Tax=Botrytis porri TaxID=87229 RepID=A0A4Z1KYC9_9HELO|nr:hypothetical protein BPOR_0104g00060 [Botrytis porri]
MATRLQVKQLDHPLRAHRDIPKAQELRQHKERDDRHPKKTRRGTKEDRTTNECKVRRVMPAHA